MKPAQAAESMLAYIRINCLLCNKAHPRAHGKEYEDKTGRNSLMLLTTLGKTTPHRNIQLIKVLG